MLEPTRRKGVDTRECILGLAETAVLEKGFGATSIEELITGAGITKSGFFYHFKDKGELAKSLLQRYLDREEVMLDELFTRADELHEDPLHGFLVGLKMFAEVMSDLPASHPGCLVAAFCYQEQLFNKDVRDLNAAGVLCWRRRFRARLELIRESYPPRIDVDLDDLADMISALAEGGLILSRVVKEKQILPQQIMLYRQFVRSIFMGV